jgi:hypothetical protein
LFFSTIIQYTVVFCFDGTGIWTQSFSLQSKHSTIWATPPAQ